MNLTSPLSLQSIDVIDWVRTTTGTSECPRNPSGTPTGPPTCATVSGTDPGKTCVFPFRFKGVLYNACTFEGNAPEDTKPWCSTLNDSNDDAVVGEGYWGFCDASCPVA